jgi:hypothetical protein
METRRQNAIVSCLLLFIAAASGLLLSTNLPVRGAGQESVTAPRALLHIASSPAKSGLADAAYHGDYKRHFETQCALIRSTVVLNKALLPREVSALASIKQQGDPIAWLQQNLETTNLKDSEVLQVSLGAHSGVSKQDQATIVNAVVKAYTEEVANQYTQQRSARLDNLARLKEQYGEMLKERRSNLRKLAESLGSDALLSGFDSGFDKKELARFYHSLRAQYLNLRLDRAKAETLLARRKQGEGDATEPVRKEIARLEDRLAVLSAREKVLDDELRRVSHEMRGVTSQVLDRDALKDEISQMEDTFRKISAELEALRVELGGIPRVRIIEEAIPRAQ